MASSLVVFDAVGTLIKPVVGVVETYHSTGQLFGSRLSIDQVRDRFRKGRMEIFRRVTDLESSDEIEHQLWRQLVSFVFDDVSDPTSLFDMLWTKFAQVDSWAKFDDVDDCLESLTRSSITCVIGSNFDSRLLGIIDRLFGDDYFEQVFCSSLLGYRKPAPQFYRYIAEQFPDYQITMIGDDRENDILAPQRLGWNAIQIDRKSKGNSDGAVSDLRLLKWRFIGD